MIKLFRIFKIPVCRRSITYHYLEMFTPPMFSISGRDTNLISIAATTRFQFNFTWYSATIPSITTSFLRCVAALEPHIAPVLSPVTINYICSAQ